MRVGRFLDYDVLLLTAAIWFLGKFLRYAFPPLFEPLQATYGVSNAAVGAAFTGFMIVYALLQFPSGVLADRVGAVRVIVVGATVAGIGALALVVDSSFAALVAIMVIIGAGTGAHKTAAIRLLSRVYPARTGRAIGALDTIGAFGGVVAPAAIVVFLSAPPVLEGLLSRLPGADWRGLFLVSGVVALMLAFAFFHRVPGRLPVDADRGTAADAVPPTGRQYLSLFGRWRFTAFVVVTIAVAFAYNGTIAFLPLYLSREVGLPSTTAALLYSVLFAVSFVQLVSGDLSDRVGRLPLLAFTIGLATVALVALVLFARPDTVVIGALVVAFGLGAHGYRPVRSAYLMELLPDWIAGGGLGVVRTLLMGAGAIAPGVVGILADVSGFRPAFALLALSLLVAAVGTIGLWITEP